METPLIQSSNVTLKRSRGLSTIGESRPAVSHVSGVSKDSGQGSGRSTESLSHTLKGVMRNATTWNVLKWIAIIILILSSLAVSFFSGFNVGYKKDKFEGTCPKGQVKVWVSEESSWRCFTPGVYYYDRRPGSF